MVLLCICLAGEKKIINIKQDLRMKLLTSAFFIDMKIHESLEEANSVKRDKISPAVPSNRNQECLKA